jgi:hypothetical protein
MKPRSGRYRVVEQPHWGFPDHWTLETPSGKRLSINIRGKSLAKRIAAALNREALVIPPLQAGHGNPPP